MARQYGEYEYQEALAAATAPGATAEDRMALFDWLERYDSIDWNGEGFRLEHGDFLVPVYEESPDGDFVLIDCEIR